jgi:hypothetical protein
MRLEEYLPAQVVDLVAPDVMSDQRDRHGKAERRCGSRG